MKTPFGFFVKNLDTEVFYNKGLLSETVFNCFLNKM